MTAPSRSKLLIRLTKAIKSWKLSEPLSINYHSIDGLLRLVKVKHTPQCVHLAVWTLANIIFVERKYIIYF